jgi:hypothetical protein
MLNEVLIANERGVRWFTFRPVHAHFCALTTTGRGAIKPR